MVSSVRQVLGLALATIGFLGSIIICALPRWTIMTLTTGEVSWGGLWKICLKQKTGQTQCLAYSPLALSPDLQASRALVIITIILGVFGIVLGVVGGKCTPFIEDQRRKCKVAIAAGILFIIAGLMVLISVCWITNNINQLSNILELINANKIELGASIYIGWLTAGLLFLGGVLLCSLCFPRDETNHSVRYRADP